MILNFKFLNIAALKYQVLLSTELDIWSSSWRIVNFNWGEYFVFSSIVCLGVTEHDVRLTTILGVIGGQLLVNFLFFLSSLFFPLLLFILDIFYVIVHFEMALVVILDIWFNTKVLLELFSAGFFSSSPQPNDQLDLPPGLLTTLTLVWADSPILC